MQINTLIKLDWDTSFFGYKVAKIFFDQSGGEYFDDLIREIKSEAIRLTYLFVNPSDIGLNNDIKKKGGLLVDGKTVFSKTPQPHNKFDNKIIEFTGREPDDRLVELALHAGLYSRFRIDRNFRSHEFERLYTQWLVKSIDKTLAFKVLVAVYGDSIVGLTTLGEKENNADIGLVSVDSSYTGRGIGTDMIHYADNIAFEKKYEKIRVVTQQQNARACKLYEKCGFHFENITNVYHLWL
jgi:dTDP-4-amino-4,6-dideoxy-D-galactose acyltransferase